jgi:S-DNA-T family DNA segregation ATPase FtsK/SpoIIIE
MSPNSTIKLLLSICDPASDAHPADVIVELTRDTPVHELSEALARYVRSLHGDSIESHPVGGLALHCARLGRLAASDCVSDTGLRSGDTMALAAGMRFTAMPPGRSAAPARDPALPAPSLRAGVVDLVVNAGPQAGRRVSLLPGSYVLGRDPTCDVVLDDPSLSRRHLQIEVGSEGVAISDLDSRNGSAVEGRTLVGNVRLRPDDGAHIEIGRSVVTFSGAAPPILRAGAVSDGSTPFNRPPRILDPYRAPHLQLEAAPPEASRVRLQIGGAVLPIVLGAASAAILDQPALLLSMLLSPATLVWSYVSERRSGRRLFRQSEAHYVSRLEALAGELEQARTRESVARRAAAPDAAELTARALEMRSELWERRPANEDFLALRIGVADLPAEFSVETPAGDREPLPTRTLELLDSYRLVPMLPVVVDLPRIGSLGLAGPEGRVDGLGMWLALQTAVLHSPRELAIAAALDPDQREQWEWLKWIPHTRIDPSPLGGPQLVGDMAATQDLLQRVAELVGVRHWERSQSHLDPASGFAPALVAFLDEDLVEERALVSEILERGPSVGVYTIWLGHLQRGLPGECRSVALLDPTVARLTFIRTDGAEQVAEVTADAVGTGLALQAARALASVRDLGAPGRRAQATAGARRETRSPNQTPSNGTLGNTPGGTPDSAPGGTPGDTPAAPRGQTPVKVTPFTWEPTHDRESLTQDKSASWDA